MMSGNLNDHVVGDDDIIAGSLWTRASATNTNKSMLIQMWVLQCLLMALVIGLFRVTGKWGNMFLLLLAVDIWHSNQI